MRIRSRRWRCSWRPGRSSRAPQHPSGHAQLVFLSRNADRRPLSDMPARHPSSRALSVAGCPIRGPGPKVLPARAYVLSSWTGGTGMRVPWTGSPLSGAPPRTDRGAAASSSAAVGIPSRGAGAGHGPATRRRRRGRAAASRRGGPPGPRGLIERVAGPDRIDDLDPRRRDGTHDATDHRDGPLGAEADEHPRRPGCSPSNRFARALGRALLAHQLCSSPRWG